MTTTKTTKMVKDKASNKANANCNQVILDHFWNISDPSEEKRCRSIHIILQTLSKQVESNQNNDVNYCLDRLIRGLISTREFARHGFCVLLTKVLDQFADQIQLEDVLQQAEKEYGTKLENATSESAISWSLLIGCILKSGKLKHDSDQQILNKILDVLIHLGVKKNYVEIIICNLFEEYVKIFCDHSKLFEDIVLHSLEECSEEFKASIFFIYMVVVSLNHFPIETQSHFREFIETQVYKRKSKDYEKLLTLFKVTTKYHPNIHPINQLLIETMFKLEPENSSHFCSSIVESIFKVNLEKTSLGFEIVRILLQLVEPDQVELVLSSNFLRLFIQTLNNKKHPLHNSATELGNYLVQFSSQIRDKSELQFNIARCLIQLPGSINFDVISKTKILQSILKNFGNDAIRLWVTMVKEMMIEQEVIPASDFIRLRCLQQIPNLLKSYTENDEFIWGIAKYLFLHSYVDVSASKSIKIDEFKSKNERLKCQITPNLQKEFPHSFKTTFVHIVHHSATSVTSQQDKLSKQIETLTKMVDFILSILSKKNIKLIFAENVDADQIKNAIIDMKEKIDQMASSKKRPIETNVFKLLYLNFIIELFENNKDAFKSTESDDEENDDEEMDEVDDEEEGDEQMETNGNVDSDNDSEEEDEIMEVEGNEKVDEQFRMDVLKALGGAVDNSVNDTDDDDDEEDEVVSDSEMFKLDDALSEVFRKKFGEKKRSNERQNQIQAFKFRAVDLLQIIVEHKQSMSFSMALELASSILAMSKSHYALKNMLPLTTRCIQMFNTISKKRFNNIEDDQRSYDEGLIKKMFDQLIAFQYKCNNGELQKSLVAISSWLLIVTKGHLNNYDLFHTAIEKALKDLFCRPNIELKTDLFVRLIPQLCEVESTPFLMSDYYKTLVDYCFNTKIRTFQRGSAVHMLCSLLNGVKGAKQLDQLGQRIIELMVNELDDYNTNKTPLMNLLMKLAVTCQVFQVNNPKMNGMMKQLDGKLSKLPKELRKKLNKQFINKVRNTAN
ncbi:hypothetical protein RDWZM_006793 [Blomia tropicalis]|uniref:Uncharacterized protein n=1 Tax=Blomia tropicalis TaxID=40697 RepID=A0A9Q0M7R6_BLOTA|nr:hypothetical protein RDWZM_006793 [Blomia tropicalis]